VKKIIKDVRFLLGVFLLIFVVICGAVVNVALSNGNILPVSGRGPSEPTTFAFYFKAPVLRLNENSNPNTSFLVISNQEAIIGSKVYGTAVTVETTPEFTINVVGTGQAQIHLSARLRNGEIKTVTCTVVVTGESTPSGTEPSDDDDDVDIPPIVGELLYNFETATTVSFRLVVGGENVFLFKLHAEVIEARLVSEL